MQEKMDRAVQSILNTLLSMLIIISILHGTLFRAGAITPQIAALDFFIAGLRSDGTVATLPTGLDGYSSLTNWKSIVQIAGNRQHLVGLKSDGTLISSSTAYGLPWTGITQVSAGREFVVGLKNK